MSIKEQNKIEEMARRSIYKHRGEIVKVANETQLPAEYITKLVKKIERGNDWRVSSMVANDIAKEILVGRQSRISQLTELFDRLTEVIEKRKSYCCNALVRPLAVKEGEEQKYECTRCGDPADSRMLLDESL
jgi:hypothetical protein